MVSYSESFESVYQGEYSSLSPDYGNFIGYRLNNASTLGFPGSSQTGNQLGETINALKQGIKSFEVTMLSPEVAEAIPKQHFKEMRALMKLSGVKPSLHGPVVDAAGFTDKGWGGNYAREDNERRMMDAIEKAHELDPKGNVPIVFHSTNGIPGPEFVPGKEGEERFKVEKTFAIDRESGKMAPIEREFKFRPSSPGSLDKGGEEFTPEEQLRSINVTEWENKLTDLATFNKHADEIIGAAPLELKGYENAAIQGNKAIDLKTGKELPMDEIKYHNYQKLRDADVFLENVQLNFNSAFHRAYKFGSPEQKDQLKELAEKYSKKIKDLRRGEDVLILNPVYKQEVLKEAIDSLKNITRDRAIEKNGEKFEDERYGAPQVFQDIGEFAMDKASETFGNLAIKSYKEYGKNAPIIAVENMFQGMAFSKADEMKELVEKSRERFVDYLVDKKKMSEKEARKVAEKNIGVTWDVGHLNLMKKKGFTDEDIIAETKKIGKLVKHVHLTDNFGYGDSHLAPGMGNVPFKKILETLEKEGDFENMRKIVEAGGVVQHFKRSPHPWTLSAFGSPIYGAKMPIYWNQAMETMGSYFGGYGTLNPEGHHNLYGAGFTTLPSELGGQMPSAGKSRFGGTPMA